MSSIERNNRHEKSRLEQCGLEFLAVCVLNRAEKIYVIVYFSILLFNLESLHVHFVSFTVYYALIP